MAEKYLNCVIYDLRQGFAKRFHIYIITVILFAFLGMTAYTALQSLATNPSAGDLAVQLFTGAEIYHYTALQSFVIPFNYMITTAFLGLTIGSFVPQDFQIWV